MIPATLFLICAILAPFVAHIRKWQSAAFFAVAAVTYLTLGGLGVLATQLALSKAATEGTPVGDTYYVVSRGYFSINLGIMMAVVAFITWLQQRLGAMFYPKLTMAAFWILHLGIIGSNSASTFFTYTLTAPARYSDYQSLFQTSVLVTWWSSFFSSAAILALISLLALSTIRLLILRRST